MIIFTMNRIDIVNVVTILKVLLVARIECFGQGTMTRGTTCHGTEVYVLGRNQSSIQVSCNCSGANSCSWVSPSYQRDIFSSRGSSESLLLEWTDTIGYGNFSCIRDNYSVVKSILILPDTPSTSCDGCINATICRATTGKYLYRFSILLYFPYQSTMPPCELRLIDTTSIVEITEGQCVDLLPNSSYSMQCLICPDNDIYYAIPTSNVEDCSNSDVCSQLSPVITAMSTVISSGSSTAISTSTVTLPSLIPSSSLIHTTRVIPTTMEPEISGKPSTNDKDNNLGAILGGVLGALMILVVVIIIIILYWQYSRIGQCRSPHVSMNEIYEDQEAPPINAPRPGSTVSIEQNKRAKLMFDVLSKDTTQVNSLHSYQTMFAMLATKMEAEWEPLGRMLEIGENNIHVIRSDYRGVQEQTVQMLHKWLEINGSSATLGILTGAVYASGSPYYNLLDILNDYAPK